MANAHDTSYLHDEQNDDRLLDTRQCNMPNFAETSGTVKLGSLIQLQIDTGDSGKIDDAVPSDLLPDTASYINRTEILRRSSPRY